MNPEFLKKLKATLDALIAQNKAVVARIEALEHSVNDVIIGGLRDASDEFADNECFSEFVDEFKPIYEPYGETTKILYGDDYDIAEELYDLVKGQDNAADLINQKIEEIKSKLSALEALKNQDKANDPVVVETSIEEGGDKSVEDYLKELDKQIK